MIHGSKRVKHKKTEQQIKEEVQLSEKINTKLAQFFAIPRKDINPLQIPKYLEFIALLMQLVSDIPTVFNFRRELIELSISGKSPQEVAKALGGEIKLTTKLIQSDTKSYTIWSYRQWLIKSLFNINPQIIKAEKELIKMLLTKDEKNFHVWNYRNWLNSIQSFINEEIQFTEEKIKSNPFNFSPLHFRSKFIYQKYSQVLKQSDLQNLKREEIMVCGMSAQFFSEQLQRVKTAIFLNPNEEAPWLYYNWLLGQLVPAFIVRFQKIETGAIVHLNMKVSDFSALIEGQNVSSIGKTGQSNSDCWSINFSSENIKINTNLQKPIQIKLQSTGRLFLAQSNSHQSIKQQLKRIFNKEIKFLDEVIESQEQQKCRFAFLQKASIKKFILQCGTSEPEFASIVNQGLQTLKSIESENKANKYIKKQIEYWQRLLRNQLSVVEQALKHKDS